MVKKVYYYVVLFATLIMTIGGSVSSVMAIADIVSPQPYYQSFESFKEMKYAVPKETGDGSAVERSEQELKAMYDSMVAAETAHARTRAINSLIKSLAWVIIPLPVFIYFQRRVQKLEKE